jgi:hypothetical protein
MNSNPTLVMLGLAIIAWANGQRLLQFAAEAAMGERVFVSLLPHPSKVPKLGPE